MSTGLASPPRTSRADTQPRREAAVADRLAETAGLLARRNEALEDFAALVAHEVKASLQLSLRSGGASVELERAMELVDAILDAERTEPASAPSVPQESLDEALLDLGETSATIEAVLPPELPLEGTALRIVFRNLIGNALSAGATRVRIVAAAGRSSWNLSVIDDGVGLEDGAPYAHGSGLGFALCRRIVERAGGTLELRPTAAGGTRASIMLPRRSP